MHCPTLLRIGGTGRSPAGAGLRRSPSSTVPPTIMRAVSLELINFRNFEHQAVALGPGVNLFYGKNAQGKTNLLESLSILSTAKSFRQGRERDWIRFGADAARVLLTYQAYGDTHTLELRILPDARKEILANGLPIARNSELALKFCTVLFEPGHLNLVKESPEQRRRFLDTAIGQLKPRYAGALEDYHRIMGHKNVLLRRGGDAVQIEVFNERLAVLGGYLTLMRGSYVNKLAQHAAAHHGRLSGGAEALSVEYSSFLGRSPEADDLAALQQSLREELQDALWQEQERGLCLVGPHRDDVELSINGTSARTFGSQGQQRSAALSLKLAECDLVQETVGEPPLLLLDDVMSELDRGRQQYIRQSLGGRQAVITTCATARGAKEATVFTVKDGVIEEWAPKSKKGG